MTLVIASHSLPTVAGLPWPLKRFAYLGFYGVQLFFVLSCFTLAHSVRSRPQAGLARFALRRLFRILPAYFVAAAGYLILLPAAPITAMRAITFLTFTSGWSPAQMPTVAGAWIGVPGGWSIETEMGFYALFPAVIVLLRGTRRSTMGLAASLVLAWMLNWLGQAAYLQTYGAVATNQFLYYWLPNQLPVFLSGLVLYEIFVAVLPIGASRAERPWLESRATLLVAAGTLLFASLAFVGVPRLPAPESGFLASHIMAAAAFCLVTLGLAFRPGSILINPLVVSLGRISFSAYLVHFAVIAAVEKILPAGWMASTGIAAAILSVGFFVLVLGTTFLLAQATYQAIERPGIKLGSRLINRLPN